MPRLNFLLCSGFSLISVAVVNAQNFPKNPTLQQIVGFQLNQVQNWQMEQLPANSVLYQFKSPVPKIKSNQISDFEPIIRFPVQPETPVMERLFNEIYPVHLSSNQSYADWLKQSRWHLIKKHMRN